MDLLGVGGGSTLVLIIKTPHTLHTHSRSSLYIYEVFQHLLLWLEDVLFAMSVEKHSLKLYIFGCQLLDARIDTFERRRGNTTTWYTTPWSGLHLTL